jgi:hypothetical protein
MSGKYHNHGLKVLYLIGHSLATLAKDHRKAFSIVEGDMTRHNIISLHLYVSPPSDGNLSSTFDISTYRKSKGITYTVGAYTWVDLFRPLVRQWPWRPY